jgi:ATP-dependent Clp protease ATP-binding subunit ClpX
MLTINTKNILFILGGAFVGMEEVISKRTNSGSSIGFGGTVGKKIFQTNRSNQ